MLILLYVVMCLSVCVSAMHDASRRLQDCLADMYEPDWFGKEEMDTLAEVRAGNSLLMHEIGSKRTSDH